MPRFAVVAKDDQVSIKIREVLIEKLTANNFSFDAENPEIIIVVGGDGTFLSAVQYYLPISDHAIFTGVHTGTLGFFADYTFSQLSQCLTDITTTKPQVEIKRLLKITTDGPKPETNYALNEARIENIVRTQVLDVYINDEQLEVFRGTGMCVSTQAGSTAYNRSLRSAVIEPGLSLMELSEVIGIHHSHYRSLGVPLIVDGKKTIKLVSPNQFEDGMLCFDREVRNLSGCTSVECTIADKKIYLAHYQPQSFVKRLSHLF